jgi:uncharacterized protein YbbK (DUF523 family)/uncharacterized protein YbgA (DUF1722 family)
VRETVRLGISACLLGEKVRWNAGHKRDDQIIATVGPFVEWVPVCPEREIGMGVPRPPLRLRTGANGPRMVDPQSGHDHTVAMRRFAAARVRALVKEDLDGYVLKKDSPSCGRDRVRVYGVRGKPKRAGVGLFAAALMEVLPLLPVEEESRLHDPRWRENFFTRVLAYRRLKAALRPRWTAGDLARFHAAEVLLLMAHEPRACRKLTRMLNGAAVRPRAELARRYPAAFLDALRTPATRRRHVLVLRHIRGCFNEWPNARARAELTALIADFARGWVPLSVPLTLIRGCVRRFAVSSLAGQTYFAACPEELMLRNQA